MKWRFWNVLTIGSILMAVVGASPRVSVADSAVETVRGTYLSLFETSAFRPCGTNETWWVNVLPDRFNERYEGVSGGKPVPVWVVWRGSKGEKGHWGHMGAYDREFQVLELLEISQASSSEPCQ